VYACGGVDPEAPVELGRGTASHNVLGRHFRQINSVTSGVLVLIRWPPGCCALDIGPGVTWQPVTVLQVRWNCVCVGEWGGYCVWVWVWVWVWGGGGGTVEGAG
jgi:hypothetical protein